MSKIYSINIKLMAESDKDNIAKVLARGAQKGFKYFDNIGEETYDNMLIIDAQKAAQKLVESYQTKPELGPCVFTHMPDPDDPAGFDDVRLWFDKANDGWLEFDMGFGAPKKKTYYIDFDYYLRICLDLVQDFQILEIHATME